MIRSFGHKGLKRLYEDDDDRGIRPDLLGRIEDIPVVWIALEHCRPWTFLGIACTQ